MEQEKKKKSEKFTFHISYDESFKTLMKLFFSDFARVETDFEIIDLPKRVDLLIIELLEPIEQYVEIFKYFKKFNIIEFKSERNPFKMKEDLYKLGIYINGTFLKEPATNIQNTTFTIVTSLRPGKLLRQYNAKLIRQGLYIIENISVIPVYVVVAEEVEIGFEKEIPILKEYTSKKDRYEYLLQLIRTKGKIKYFDKIFDESYKLFSKDTKKIIEQEGIMNSLERDFLQTIKNMGLYQKIVDEGRESGKNYWMQQGLQQGLQQGIETIAKNALLQGLTIESIVKLTGLSKAQVRKLKNSIGN